MIAFIDSTDSKLKKIAINISAIEAIANEDGRAMIITTTRSYTLEESYEEICSRLSDLANEVNRW